MKNYQRGFIVPVIIIIIAALIVGGVYTYSRSHSEIAPSINNITATTSISTIPTTTSIEKASQEKVTVKTPPTKSTVAVSSSEPLSIKIVSPNGGENIKIGSVIQVKWNSNKTLSPKEIFVINTRGAKAVFNASATNTSYSYPLTIHSTGVTGDILYDVKPGPYRLQVSLYDGIAPRDNNGKTCAEEPHIFCNDTDTYGKLLVEDESDSYFTLSL